MKTTINGRLDEVGTWTPEITDEWSKRVSPLLKGNEWCSHANYYTPRPYVDEYNTGSDHYGFLYVMQPGNRVCFVSWV